MTGDRMSPAQLARQTIDDERAERAAEIRDPEECPDPSTHQHNAGFFHVGADQRDPIACMDEARVDWWL